MDAALEHGYQRLETEMIEFATASLDLGSLRDDWLTGAIEAPSPLLRMSFEQICQMLGRHHRRVNMKQDCWAHNRRVYSAEETDAVITS